MKLNFYYHLHYSKQCIIFSRITITFAGKNPTFARITPLHLYLFFQGKYKKIKVNSYENSEITYEFSISFYFKGLGAIRDQNGPTSDVDKIFSKMYSQYVLFRNKYS